jgi:tetratricopeptide (TPR) repeat protein
VAPPARAAAAAATENATLDHPRRIRGYSACRVSLRSTARILFVVLVALLTVAEARAQAGANDADVRALIKGIFEAEVAQNKLDEAIEKLEVAKVVCEGDACSPKVRAELHIAIGTVHARLGSSAEAKEAFRAALKEDKNAKLVDKYANAAVKKAWAAAKGNLTSEAKKGCRSTFEKDTEPGRTWQKAEAYHCYTEAKAAEDAKDFKQCWQDARASLDIESRIGTRSLLARCLEGDNRWIDAIAEYEELGRIAPEARQLTVAKRAAGRAAMLQRRIPVLIVKPPPDAEDLVVKLDGTTLPTDVLDTEMPVDPGKHKVEAQGTRDNLPLTFEEELVLEPGRTLTLPVRLAPGPPKWATRAELQCMLVAKNPDEFAKCLNKRVSTTSDLKVRIGTEISGYHDDMNVDVLTPNVSFSLEHVTDGWNVGASFLVDVVTAASVDIISMASPRWTEVRWVPAIHGGYKIDPVILSATASLSHEPDYISASVGGQVALELAQKTVTPSLGYEYSHDINGKVETPFSVYSLLIDRHALNAGLGLVLTKATFGQAAFTAVFEDGDSSKPYRHIPMFSEAVQAQLEGGGFQGFTVDAVNLYREPERPLEQLPTDRKRFALALSVAHRFTDATLRLSERGYIDDWGLKASTTDGRLMYDVLKELRIWPHLRFHIQSGTNFYRLAYALVGPDRLVPAVRTGDRELGPLLGITVGAGAHVDLGERKQWGITLAGDFIYTRFLDHLYVKQRLAGFGALGFEAEFE